MEMCPFLTTYDEKVECFKECAFYNCDENGGICPFKQFEDSNQDINDILNKEYEMLDFKKNVEYVL